MNKVGINTRLPQCKDSLRPHEQNFTLTVYQTLLKPIFKGNLYTFNNSNQNMS